MSTSVYAGLNPFNFIRKYFPADLLVPKRMATFLKHGNKGPQRNLRFAHGNRIDLGPFGCNAVPLAM